MKHLSRRIGAAAIIENLLKRRWSVILLRHFSCGVVDPAEIAKSEPGISPKVMSERLRVLVRYAVLARFPGFTPNAIVEYRLTALGKRVLKVIDMIEQLDAQLHSGVSLSRMPFAAPSGTPDPREDVADTVLMPPTREYLVPNGKHHTA